MLELNPSSCLCHLNLFVFLYNSTIVYLEGNLETKIFTDPVTGLVRRIREVAIRRNGIDFVSLRCTYLHWGKILDFDLCFFLYVGRVVFLGKAGDMQQPSSSELRGVGYY